MPIMNDINKEMIKLEEKYKDFFDSIPSVFIDVDHGRKSNIGEFYGLKEKNKSSFAFFNDELKHKLSAPIIKEMQAIIDDFNR